MYPWLTVYWDDGTWANPIGRNGFEEEDRVKLLTLILTSIGKTMHFDYRGSLVVATPPDPAGLDWTVDAGRNGVLTSVSRSITRDGICNGVVAKGEGADDVAPVVATVVDLNPASPTYWNGPFGKVPRFYTSPLLTTVAQATAAATTILRRSVGLPYAVDFAAIVNPALEPGDTVEVILPAKPGVAVTRELHVLDRITIPLNVDGAMSAGTRIQNVAADPGVI